MPIINSTRRISPLDINKDVSIGVAFPINQVNLFTGTKTVKEQVKSNLINVLLTERGERVYEPEFGVGLRNLLFEPDIDVDNLNERINQQIQYYIPEITLLDTIVNYIEDKQTLYITVSYSVNLDGTTDAVQLNFNY